MKGGYTSRHEREREKRLFIKNEKRLRLKDMRAVNQR